MRNLLPLCLVLAACGESTSDAPEGSDIEGFDGKADGLMLVEATPGANGVLALVNDPSTTFELLDDDVGLDKRAARGLFEGRPYDSIKEMDAVKWVGGRALDKLLKYAQVNGWVPSGTDLLGFFDRVPFTVDEAAATLRLVNEGDPVALRAEAGVSSRALAGIVAARPISSVLVLARVKYVGPRTLENLKAYATKRSEEIGIISDIDKTLLPPHDRHAEVLPDAYPGVAALLRQLEFGAGGAAGDQFFVTARTPDRLPGITEWMDAQQIPAGPISTGISGMPWIAEDEKVSDIEEILAATGEQVFVIFGDSSHRDPEVYRRIIAAYPDRIAAAFIHKVNNVNPRRVEDLTLIEDYGQAADVLLELGLIDFDGAERIHAQVEAAAEN